MELQPLIDLTARQLAAQAAFPRAGEDPQLRADIHLAGKHWEPLAIQLDFHSSADLSGSAGELVARHDPCLASRGKEAHDQFSKWFSFHNRRLLGGRRRSRRWLAARFPTASKLFSHVLESFPSSNDQCAICYNFLDGWSGYYMLPC